MLHSRMVCSIIFSACEKPYTQGLRITVQTLRRLYQAAEEINARGNLSLQFRNGFSSGRVLAFLLVKEEQVTWLVEWINEVFALVRVLAKVCRILRVAHWAFSVCLRYFACWLSSFLSRSQQSFPSLSGHDYYYKTERLWCPLKQTMIFFFFF